MLKGFKLQPTAINASIYLKSGQRVRVPVHTIEKHCDESGVITHLTWRDLDDRPQIFYLPISQVAMVVTRDAHGLRAYADVLRRVLRSLVGR